MDLHTCCTICDNQYDEKNRKPLVLPCSHSFCQECLQQVQASSENLCPVCRKTWGTILLSNLPSCYQLIPCNNKPDASLMNAAKKRKRQDSADPGLKFEVCKEHKFDLSMFCESCVVPVCRKCLLLNHNGCKVVLMEEKCDVLKEKSNDKISELEINFSKVTTSLLENATNMAVIRPLVEKLLSYEKEMQDYQKKLNDWQTEAEKVLAVTDDDSNAPFLCAIQNTLQKDYIVRKLDLELPKSPSSPLLLAIATAYQKGPGSNDLFLTAFKNGAKELNQGASTSYQSGDEVDLNRAVRISALDPKENRVWNILNDRAADAALRVLQTTSRRPSSIKISCPGVSEVKLTVLATAFAGIKQYEVTLNERLYIFESFDTPFDESVATTALRLDALLKHSPWANLTHFWGHLNVAGIQSLPMTIQSLGLVLRDEVDMASVNALSGQAWDQSINRDYTIPMLWPKFSLLELSISKTFSAKFWVLSWRTNTSISLNSLSYFSVNLYLPDLSPIDHLWVAALFKEMGLKKDHRRGKKNLYLPRTSIDPESFLGVLRDSGLCWEVHLPARLPQVVPREVVTNRYKKWGHYVYWDQE